MEEERKITDTGQHLDIYDARLTFIKTGKGKIVRVVVRPKRKGPARRGKFPFTGDINDDDSKYWTMYKGQPISVYHRRERKDKKDRYEYVNEKQRGTISTGLGQRLEVLVRKVYFKTPTENSE